MVFDDTSVSPANYVQGELKYVTSGVGNDSNFIVFDNAPFYVRDFRLWRKTGASSYVELFENVDFFFALPFLSLTRATGRTVYGAVVINTTDNISTTTFKSNYRAVGGNYWFMTGVNTIEAAANLAYNPRVVAWEEIHGTPVEFPAQINHNNPLDDLTRLQDVLDKLQGIIDAIGQSGVQGLTHHISQDNAHNVTSTTLGLEFVANFGPATNAEAANAGVSNKVITPSALASVLQSYATLQALNALAQRVTNLENA